jgi:multidrug efflux pump subunit AcrA (membrane-fusion protein)
VTIKDILAKAAKGEQLTEDERAVLAGYDPDGAVNSAAAAARKKAEADAAKAAQDAADLKAKLDEALAKLADFDGKGKSEMQKLADQVASLTKQVADANAEKAKLVRQQKLDDVIRASGLQFVKEVDGSIMRGALVKEFEGLPDDALADAEKVTPIINTFRARNRAVILDTSGHGAGNPPHDPGAGAADRAKRIEDMSPAERKADLKKSGVL